MGLIDIHMFESKRKFHTSNARDDSMQVIHEVIYGICLALPRILYRSVPYPRQAKTPLLARFQHRERLIGFYSSDSILGRNV
jgi:hypothetical protein